MAMKFLCELFPLVGMLSIIPVKLTWMEEVG